MSEVDEYGEVLKTFTEVKSPEYLLIDTEDRVLVVDGNDTGILLLSSELLKEPITTILQPASIATLCCAQQPIVVVVVV